MRIKTNHWYKVNDIGYVKILPYYDNKVWSPSAKGDGIIDLEEKRNFDMDSERCEPACECQDCFKIGYWYREKAERKDYECYKIMSYHLDDSVFCWNYRTGKVLLKCAYLNKYSESQEG